jgi:arginyl-tRNA synthetase
VGLGAILFADVSSKRIKDVRFSWEEILSFEGETGPYLQYTAVRTLSLLRKHDQPIHSQIGFDLLSSEEEASVIRTLSFFPMTLARAEAQREPFLLSQYLIELARVFNRFYNAHRILDVSDSKLAEARMLLVSCVSDVLRTGLKLLGIPSPERM